ncbi:MAG: isopentenyl phosphate kinase [Candidatus ainarchaeum sp.]|nr:isopentenyl phosphate kinase [Candidatus ainarchaeum sp.]
MPDLYIMKLGGSVCTNKAENQFRVNEGAVRNTAKEIARARKEKKFRLIMVNGAGPFGHTNVANYNINNGLKSAKDFEGFCKVAIDCNFLNQEVSRIFWEEGLLAYPLAASAITIQKNKKISSQGISVIEELFRQNQEIIPVLNGTMCPDIKLKGSVVSGDATIANIAKKLKAKKIFLGTDVAGVFTADPKKEKNAKRIELINKKNFDEIIEQAGESTAIDVTQGMKGKLLKIRQMSSGIETIVFDATKPENVFNALVGKEVEGTKIRL